MFTIEAPAGRSPSLRVVDRYGALPPVTLRPLEPRETAPVLEVFEGMSTASRRLRFLTALPALTEAMLRRLTDVDHLDHGCWVAEVSTRPVGLGRYVRTAGRPSVAEIAVEVVDDSQGLGLGRVLLDVVSAAAGAVGITALSWTADPANDRVRQLAVGLGSRFALDDGLLEGTTGLLPVDGLDAARVARVARAARRRAALRSAALRSAA
jgi:GNAT superfamily N-acetyltransferase